MEKSQFRRRNTCEPPPGGKWANRERANEWKNEWIFESHFFLDTQSALNLKYVQNMKESLHI